MKKFHFLYNIYLSVLGEVVVGMQVHGSEVPQVIKFKNNLHGMSQLAGSVVPPANPLVTCENNTHTYIRIKQQRMFILRCTVHII